MHLELNLNIDGLDLLNSRIRLSRVKLSLIRHSSIKQIPFLTLYPIGEAFTFTQPYVQALHRLPYSSVANSLIGSYPDKGFLNITFLPQIDGFVSRDKPANLCQKGKA